MYLRLRIETRGWVDIENDYYQLLKECSENTDCGYTVKELNEQMAFLQEKLVEYLRTIDVPVTIETINSAIRENICIEDLSIEGKALAKTMGVIEYDTNAFDDNRYMDERFSGMPPVSTNYLKTGKQRESSANKVTKRH